MWLPTSISILLLCEGAWRIAVPGESTPERASAYFNGANFIVFGLLGLCCVFWPAPSLPHEKDKPAEPAGDHSPAGEQEHQVSVVVVDASPPKEDEKDGEKDQSLDVTARPPKRQVMYLTNLKTFLTFIVVTFHCVGAFSGYTGGLNTQDVLMKGDQVSTVQFGSFYVGAIWFSHVNQYYFMSAFYFISAYFCPNSFARKGFRMFVIDKLLRLGGPFLLYSALFGPLLGLSLSAYVGLKPLTWEYNAGTCWFILWLLNFSIAYAVLAQLAKHKKVKQVLLKRKIGMPHPFILVLGGLALGGVFYGMSGIVGVGSGMFYMSPWYAFGDMCGWQYGVALYIPFFIAGVLGGHNDWLRSVEEMKTWVVWTLRLIVVGFWILFFLTVGMYAIPIPSLYNGNLETSPLNLVLVQRICPPVYAVPMTLAIIQFFHQHFNATPQSKFMRGTGLAAYMVYVFQFCILNPIMIIFVEILKAAGLPIIYGSGDMAMFFFKANGEGQPELLPDSVIWGGWVFVTVLTQLILWPLCFYLLQLPVLNKMFCGSSTGSSTTPILLPCQFIQFRTDQNILPRFVFNLFYF